MQNTPTLASLAADLAEGATSARKLVEQCLARIADPAGEVRPPFPVRLPVHPGGLPEISRGLSAMRYPRNHAR